VDPLITNPSPPPPQTKTCNTGHGAETAQPRPTTLELGSILWGDGQALSHWGLGCIVCATAKERGLNITTSFATYDVRSVEVRTGTIPSACGFRGRGGGGLAGACAAPSHLGSPHLNLQLAVWYT
jgi:hypothetical protein